MDYLCVLHYVESENRRRRQSRDIRLINRRIRDASNPFEVPTGRFLKLFRLSKISVEFLHNSLRTSLDVNKYRNSIPSLTKILAALHFYGHGGYQVTVGHGLDLGISQPSVSKCLREVTESIINVLMDEMIVFPTTSEEKEKTKLGFQRMYGMPGVLGAVDGTHIAIVSPPKLDTLNPGIRFFNRKGFYSLNCQFICDSKMKISNVNANYPGSTHDAAIFTMSGINSILKNNYIHGNREEWILGDSGYTQLPWVMTPYNTIENSAQENYNKAHIKTRSVIERCFGVMKGRFRCLLKHRVLHYKPEMACKIIYAIATLHNICIMRNDPLPDESEIEEDHHEENVTTSPAPVDNNFFAAGRNIRNNIVRRYFS